MKILVCPHDLGMGGSQLNAIELAAAVQRRGHSVVVYGPDGELRPFLADLSLRFIAAPDARSDFSYRNFRRISEVARELNVDVIHAYEWPPSIQAAFGPNLRWSTPTVMTVLSMSVPDFLPTHLPIIVGTRELAEQQAPRRDTVYLLEPPIDVEQNRPKNPASARSSWGFSPDQTVLSVVCRLTGDLEKLEGVVHAISVVDDLASQRPVRLLIAGDGEGRTRVEAAAAAVNGRHGQDIVVVAGNLLDPRPAYDAADIVLGMGSSALKGMAFAKPLVVQGTGGYWKLLDERSADTFLVQGWFGHGATEPDGLHVAVEYLLADPGRAAELGAFGRDLVVRRFSLENAADVLLSIYDQAIDELPSSGTRWRSLGQSAFEVAKFRAVVGARRVMRPPAPPQVQPS